MRTQKSYFVYILASLSGTLYIGVTNDLQRRAFQHKQHDIEGFTKEYDVDRLVYYETFFIVSNAIAREKQLKGWRREKKIALIEMLNPQWKDLSREWYESRGPSTRPAKAAGLAQDDSGKNFAQKDESNAGLAQDDSGEELVRAQQFVQAQSSVEKLK
jgi:putative endonuclease